MADKVGARTRANSTNSVTIDPKAKTSKYSGIEQITRYLNSKDDNKLDTDPLNLPNDSNDRDTPPQKSNKGNGKKTKGNNKGKENVTPSHHS